MAEIDILMTKMRERGSLSRHESVIEGTIRAGYIPSNTYALELTIAHRSVMRPSRHAASRLLARLLPYMRYARAMPTQQAMRACFILLFLFQRGQQAGVVLVMSAGNNMPRGRNSEDPVVRLSPPTVVFSPNECAPAPAI